MREFFYGWRRKAGVGPLVMACLLTTAWFRSTLTRDVLQLRIGTQSIYFVISNRSQLYWQCVREEFPSQLTSQAQGSFVLPRATLESFHFSIVADDADYSKIVTTEGFSFVIDGRRIFPGMKMDVWVTPFCSLVLPLTLLSAYLILGRPRKQQPTVSKPHA